ncbi:helix-turn-helix transcriptional regulator [Methyloligella sp. 2.7D]|uniref:helix-turn-helix transcriptional regulator n=1 Tax=unclassified Methyloligella TaxID=2625955 RepID=UPI001FEE8497|nr:helix-turn-helix transcriptional regulator [Methyloligella sp. GL2]
MYERADSPDLAPIWSVQDGRALFAGPLGHNRLHSHSTAVLLTGLYDSFPLSIGHRPFVTVRSAVIPAGVAYEFDMAGAPLSVFYLDPVEGGAETLAPLMDETEEIGGALIGRHCEIGIMREIYEAASAMSWADTALADLTRFGESRNGNSIDPRFRRAVETIATTQGAQIPVDALAKAAGLSPSRFQHLFTRHVGVPYRRYRTWQRLRIAIAEIVKGSSFTMAAHQAGFFDQAHFARAFRKTFGAPASPSLVKLRR